MRDNKIVEQIPWIDLGHKHFALSLAAIFCMAVFGLDSLRVASPISPKVAFNRHTQAQTDSPTVASAIYKWRETARFGRQRIVA